MKRTLALLPALGLASCAIAVSFDDYGVTDRARAPLYTVGGTISGLDGTRTTLFLGSLSLDVDDGTFTFPRLVADGIQWVVTAADTESRTCSVANGEGTISHADATGVLVTCIPKAAK
jgi:hypothetical protein